MFKIFCIIEVHSIYIRTVHQLTRKKYQHMEVHYRPLSVQIAGSIRDTYVDSVHRDH